MKQIFFLIFLVLNLSVYSQTGMPFWNDIRQFQKQDSMKKPETGQVLLIGSSSFTLWKDVSTYFPEYKILNRAFGGSTLKDLIRYFPYIVGPYKPHQILIYCGENDFAEIDTLSTDIVFDRFTSLFEMIRALYPEVPIAYIGMKPSPSRQHLIGKFQFTNGRIREYLSKKTKADYIDAYRLMTDHKGQIRQDIWLDDKLHMNASGYALWKGPIESLLNKYNQK